MRLTRDQRAILKAVESHEEFRTAKFEAVDALIQHGLMIPRAVRHDADAMTFVMMLTPIGSEELARTKRRRRT